MADKKSLPNTSSQLFLTDGGLETTLVFIEGFELPCFAAFDLLKDEAGVKAIENYYRKYLALAQEFKTGFILETPTWRANPDWIREIGYSPETLTEINERSVQLMVSLKDEFQSALPEILISGCIGPRGDGYKAENKMTADEAEKYHSVQIIALAAAGVDMISGLTINYAEEAIGITRAASSAELPVVISFTVETDGKLPSGMRLSEAIKQVDEATDSTPIYYMINCAHPSHFENELIESKWIERIKGIRANASCKSHAELDESTELDRGDPHGLGIDYKRLKQKFKHLKVFGGCCGTDEEHVREIAMAVTEHR